MPSPSLPAQAQQPAKHDWENVSMLGATAVARYRCRRCGASFSTAEPITGGVGPCTTQQPTSAHTAGRLHVGMRDGCNASQLYIYDGKDQYHDTIVAQVYGIPLHSTVEEASALLANAARLALCFNSHDSLVEALRAMLEAYAPKADWSQPDKLHSAVRKAGAALGIDK